MVQYKDRQAMAVIKGVEDNFEQLTSIDSLLYGTGKFLLSDSVVDYGFWVWNLYPSWAPAFSS